MPRTFVLPNQPQQRFANTGDLLDERYRIERLLGEGGMGAVYLASHVQLGRKVAVKFLRAEMAAKEDVVARFRREARAAAAIRHKNIIEVFDFGVSGRGEPYLVMEYLEGESLAALLKRVGPLSLAATSAVIEPALLALQAAHRKGIVHRDIKPDNLFLAYSPDEPPVVKLIDFGISKFTQGDLQKLHTRTGSVLGTPAYMSPEQARGLPDIDHRTDLYSMGAILYEMLTGALPFGGSGFSQYLSNLLLEEPRAPQSLYPGFPAQAEPVVLKALAKDPAKRFQSASELLDALRGLPGGEGGVERLTLHASTAEMRAFAAGDLGESVGRATKRLADDEPASSPSRTPAPTDGRPLISRWHLTLLLAALALAGAGVAAGIWWQGRSRSAVPVATPAPAVPVRPQPALPPIPQAPASVQAAANPPSAEPARAPAQPIAAPLGAGDSGDAVKAKDVAMRQEEEGDKPRMKSRTKTNRATSATARPAESTARPASAGSPQDTPNKKSRKGGQDTEIFEAFE
jgi:serine/threonine-protein kinase